MIPTGDAAPGRSDGEPAGASRGAMPAAGAFSPSRSTAGHGWSPDAAAGPTGGTIHQALRSVSRRGARRPHDAPPVADAPNANRRFVARVLRKLQAASGPVEPRREDPLTCLIGTILSQATNDRLAERAYRALRRRFPTWEQVADAPRTRVEKAIEMCGLAKQKAAAIQNALIYIRRTRGAMRLDDLRRPGLDPDRAMDELCSIGGIGVKTAAVTLMFGCGADLCAVDTHLLRILRRIGVVPPKASADRAFRILRPLIPPGRAIELHLRLIGFGRTTCRAGSPKCGDCPLRDICPWPGKDREPVNQRRSISVSGEGGARS